MGRATSWARRHDLRAPGAAFARANRAVLPAALLIVIGLAGCRASETSIVSHFPNVQPFNYDIALGSNQYHIEGYLTLSSEPGRAPALLVLNGGEGDAPRCVSMSEDFAHMGLQVACVSIPGYGRSSGPSRFVGPQSVAAASKALDLLAARPDVDATRLAVWGLGNGALAAGLLMDYDARPRALILQSGVYDLPTLWPQATWRTKLAILHEVWPSKRVMKERSVIQNLPPRLECSVLILHGGRDTRTPLTQAVKLASALKARGAHVSTCYFPKASHDLGRSVEPEMRAFLRDNLLNPNRKTTS